MTPRSGGGPLVAPAQPTSGYRPFSFVHSASGLRGLLDDVLGGYDEQRAALAGNDVQTVAEIKPRELAPGRWMLDRVYCSLQRGVGPRPGFFAASTLCWSPENRRARWFAPEDDPYLDGLGPCLAEGHAEAVLRYVPLRRFTFGSGARIVKVKRRTRLQDSYGRAAAFVRAARDSAVRVPALRDLDLRRSAYAQDAASGDSLAELASAARPESLLAEAGAVHAEIGLLDPSSLPPGFGLPEVAARAAFAARWAAVFLPEHRTRLLGAAAVVQAYIPADDPVVLGACHGDLVPSHLLGRPGSWTVIDLDLAHFGDRYRDIAMFLAGLPTDVPALGDAIATPAVLTAAEEAYLDSYQQQTGRSLDRRRLAWHRAAAEMHHLGLMVSKDRWDERAARRMLTTLDLALREVCR